MSADPGQEYFCDGMVEDIITGLSRIKWLFVIARNSSFTYKGKTVDVKQVGRELGVPYVLEGSVRKAGNRVRITANSSMRKAGRISGPSAMIGRSTTCSRCRTRSGMSVLGAIEPSLYQAEIERVRRRRPDSLDAYDLVLRAAPLALRLMPAEVAEAIPLLTQAIALEPDYADAHALLAHSYETLFVRAGAHAEDGAAAVTHAHKALAVGSDHAMALALAAMVVMLLEQDRATALEAFDRAVAIGPSNAFALTWGALGQVTLGETERGMEQARLALRLNPVDPLNFPANQALAYGSFILGRFQDGAEFARRAIQFNSGFSTLHVFLVAPLVRSGRITEAKAAAKKLLTIEPNFTISRLRFLRSEGVPEPVRANFISALKEAGLPV